MDFGNKSRVSVEPLQVEVLGGNFTVKEIILDPGQTSEEMLKLIGSTPEDRWFVMLSEGDDTTEDVLAIIDDQFEFQSVALGTLEND